MNINTRIDIEKTIARRIVRDLINNGYQVSVDNGEDRTEYTISFKNILASMFQTDEEHLIVRRSSGEASRQKGWIFFVYGNDGWDVVNDYSTSLEHIMEPINEYFDSLQ